MCKEGHLFCKVSARQTSECAISSPRLTHMLLFYNVQECVITSILDQKAGIAAHKAALIKLAEQQEEEREQARQIARSKVLADFEKGVGFGHIASRSVVEGDGTHAGSKRKEPEGGVSVTSADASSLSSLPDRAQAVAQAAEEEALAELEESQRSSRKSKLPSFWLPSMTPNEREGEVDLASVGQGMEVRCRVANERGHALSLKSLTPVHFTLDQGGEKKQKVCPTCSKQLSKHTKLAVMRSCCGTVLCDRCCGQLVERPLKAALALTEKGEKNGAGSDGKSNDASKATAVPCPVCSKKLKNFEKDVIALFREGTGYAGGGGVSEVKSKGRAFQG